MTLLVVTSSRWWTGGRRGEVRALHYYDFDFKALTLNMRHFKNNMYGVLPISEEIIAIRTASRPTMGRSLFSKAR